MFGRWTVFDGKYTAFFERAYFSGQTVIQSGRRLMQLAPSETDRYHWDRLLVRTASIQVRAY
jgi:hypothetical protein